MDEERIAELYRAYAGVGQAVALSLCGDPAGAEDVFHDAFVNCAVGIGRLRDPERFRQYLLRAVIRTAISRQRRTASETRALQRYKSSEAPRTDLAAASPISKDVADALISLPVRQRAAVAARFLLDWSESQTADAMGCRIGTVKSLTSRGLAQLRRVINEGTLDERR